MAQKSIKKNAVFNIIKTLSSIVFPLITFPYISRVLFPENIGKINFALSIVSYFSLIASLGITTYAIRECSSVRYDKGKLGDSASQIFSINILTTIVAYAALAVTLLLFRRLDNYRILITIQSLTIAATTLGADWLNSAMEDFKYISLRTVAFQLVSLVLMFIFVHKPEDYIKYAVISLVSSAGASVMNIWYRRRYCKVEFTLGIKWKQHMMPILFLFVMILAQTIFNSVDSTMLGLMKGDFEVGIYSTAHKIKNVIVQIVASLAWVVMPRMSYYFAESDYIKINAMLKKVLGIMVLIGFPCIAGSVVLSSEMIEIVSGAQYASARLPLILLMLSFTVEIFGGCFLGNMVCLPGKQEKVFMEACCFAAVVNVVLNAILIPYGGASAAAFTSGISAVIIFIWLIAKKDKRIKLNYVTEVCRAPLAGSFLIVGFCCMIVEFISGLLIRTFVSIFGSVILYGLTVLLLKNELAKEMLRSLKKVLSK